jgi:hypothetical protein
LAPAHGALGAAKRLKEKRDKRGTCGVAFTRKFFGSVSREKEKAFGAAKMR